MRFISVFAVFLGFLQTVQVYAQIPAGSRDVRVRFHSSVPPICSHGWNGRGVGVVAICQLQGRYQVRFNDGRIIACRARNCVDRSFEIDSYLRLLRF